MTDPIFATERPGARAVRDSSGELWYVYERLFGDGSQARHNLVFECASVVRRLARFPAGWRDLPDTALLALQHMAG